MKTIPVGKHHVAIVDDEDYEELSRYNWKLIKGYACRNHCKNGSWHTVQMHRQILNPPPGVEIDHANMNKLDNRRINLRLATRSQNNANIKKHADGKNRYKGVTWHKSGGDWQVRINHLGRQYLLGHFDNQALAVLAYDEASLKLHGKFGRPNLYANRYIPVYNFDATEYHVDNFSAHG